MLGVVFLGLVLIWIYYDLIIKKITNAKKTRNYNYLSQKIKSLFFYTTAINELADIGTKKAIRILITILKNSRNIWNRIEIVYSLSDTKSEEALIEIFAEKVPIPRTFSIPSLDKSNSFFD